MEFSSLTNTDKILAVEGALKGTERNIYSQCVMQGIDPATLNYPHEIPEEYQGEVGGHDAWIAESHRAIQRLVERRHILLQELDALQN